MSGASLKVSLDDAAMKQAFATARARGQDLRPAMRAIGQQGVTYTRKRFLSGKAPDGTSWKPSRKPSGQTLINKGLLLRSIHANPPEPDAVEIGSNLVYAGIHQTGGVIRAKGGGYLRFRVGGNGGWVTVKEVTIPKREYLGTNPEELAGYSQILARHVGGPLTGSAA